MFFPYFYFPICCIFLLSFMEGCNIYVVVFSSHYNFKVANACMLGFCSPELQNLDVILIWSNFV
jgi:hypothetical protein